MEPVNLPLVTRNLSHVALNRTAKLLRQLRHRFLRVTKQVRESTKSGKATLRGAAATGRDARTAAYAGLVRSSRYWSRAGSKVFPPLRRELSVRAELWRLSLGSGPIVVGPWLSEVGYEVLYWIPFVRWFADHYHVPASRLAVVSRGGVAGWYAGLADRYVELLDLFPAAEFAARNAARQARGDQKQSGLAPFDDEILTRVRALPGLGGASVLHPSLMFRLLRQFWLGNESLDYVFQHVRHQRVTLPSTAVPDLPDRFVAMKFYTGVALPDTSSTRVALRALVERVAAQSPVVLLNTGLTLDEHEDYLFGNVPRVTYLAGALTPQNNLAVQTEVIRRSTRFVGTCGGLAWLAPMLGVETLAVYADDHLLMPHLYAARHAYTAIGAARFTPFDLAALERLPTVIWNDQPSL